MEPLGSAAGAAEGQLLYSTRLVPAFWNEICNSSDPTQYTIIQKVTQEPLQETTAPLFSAAYKFTLPFLKGANPQLHAMENFPLDQPLIRGSPNLGLELDDLLTLDPDIFHDLVPFDDKCLDLYDLNTCLVAEWGIHSPATSTSSESFSDYAPPNLTEIPIIAL